VLSQPRLAGPLTFARKGVLKKMANNHNQNDKQQEDDFPKLELENGKGWGARSGGWLKRNSSLILATVIIIVLAGGIYAYTQNNQNKPFLLQDDELIQENEPEELLTEITKKEELKELVEITEIEISDEQSPEDLTVVKNEDEELIGTGGPENNELLENNEFIETAEKGEGVTHLARKALKKYLLENTIENLKPEHKIYIEDYLKNKTGTDALEIGDNKSFAKGLIQEAIQKAQNLSDEQITKISPFVPLVPNL
tara:strand:+ start:8023 stop:8784 length:762 start_codon:yes stop_codon:yes gene_type:complete